MNWDMPAASSVRFLAVRGTIWVGDCQTTYNFTLVEYRLHIDEVPWLIFSTLADALEKEFDPAFWETVNYGRKERWGFLEPPWDGKVYGAAPPYAQVRLSIFNRDAHTMRVVQPFVWNHTHLKVHPNGAMIFHEQKRLAFLLPLIVEAHELLPPKPLFWVNDDNTIPLWRTTLWTHAETIQWLAETGEPYPPELRDEIQPRIDQLKSSQHGKRAQPPPPPLPTRWTERSAAKQQVQKLQADTPQDPKGTQSTPHAWILQHAATLLPMAGDIQAVLNSQTAGVSDIHAWGLMLPSSSRVSPVTYHAVVAVRYPDLCRQVNGLWELGSFASGGLPDKPPGFQLVLWDTNSRINGLVATDLETLVSEVLSPFPHNAGFADGLFTMTTATDQS